MYVQGCPALPGLGFALALLSNLETLYLDDLLLLTDKDLLALLTMPALKKACYMKYEDYEEEVDMLARSPPVRLADCAAFRARVMYGSDGLDAVPLLPLAGSDTSFDLDACTRVQRELADACTFPRYKAPPMTVSELCEEFKSMNFSKGCRTEICRSFNTPRRRICSMTASEAELTVAWRGGRYDCFRGNGVLLDGTLAIRVRVLSWDDDAHLMDIRNALAAFMSVRQALERPMHEVVLITTTRVKTASVKMSPHEFSARMFADREMPASALLRIFQQGHETS
jgi:hypothetical protein